MRSQPTVCVSSTTNATTILQKAARLAERLQLPCCFPPESAATDIQLLYTPQGLFLSLSPGARKNRPSLVGVDFVGGKCGYRLAHDLSIRQPLAKAAGVKPGYRPDVFDATAGLGMDAFLLAALGCQVTLCERSPIIHALLADGMERAHTSKRIAPVADRMHLILGDSDEILKAARPTDNHTIYLDPMYPHGPRAALNKQQMRILRQLVGDDSDSEVLFATARRQARRRVVVKRPLRADNLAGEVPSYTLRLKSTRFDVYLTDGP